MWVDKQSAKLLDTKHFHIIFTVPKQLNPLFLHVPWVMYNLLFEAAWKAIQKVTGEQFGADAHTGMLAALHTWGSKLDLHPHLHCIVPAGVLLPSGAWKTTPNEGDYFTKGIHFTDTFRHFFHGRPSGLMGKW